MDKKIAIAFDLGRVLFDFDYNIALEKIKNRLKMTPKEIIHTLYHKDFTIPFEKGLVSPKDFYTEFRDKFCPKLSYQEFVPVWNDIFTPMPETIDLANKLKTNYNLFLISNINVLHFKSLEEKYPQVFKIFKQLILSFQVKSVKPEERIYSKLKEAAGLPYKNIIYIDDRQDLVIKARQLNLNCILFKDTDQLIEDLNYSGIAIP